MAKIREGSLVADQLRGMVGEELVFRRRKGETLVSARPEWKEGHEPSPAQQAQRTRFRQGALYAQKALADAAAKAAYREAAKATTGTAFSVAVRDFLNLPEVEAVSLDAYTGAVGSRISVTAVDDTAVVGLHVKIEQPDGTLVEEGAAVQTGRSPEWVYTATAENAAPACKVTVTALDRPGHAATKTETK